MFAPATGKGDMTMPQDSAGSALETYEVYAAAYDDFNHRYMYERWTGTLLAAAKEVGLRGDRLLDVGCGTGLSFIPMLDRGWTVTACDISPAMLDLARAKVGSAVAILAADMRELPLLGEFDLVWAVNDAINYLLSREELEAALAGMRRNLSQGGVVVFDANTLATYRTFFSTECPVDVNGRRLRWQGLMSAGEVTPGSLNEARFDAEGEEGMTHVHRQRHFPEAEVKLAIDAAGFRQFRVMGESDGSLLPDLDEDRHTKAVYLCS